MRAVFLAIAILAAAAPAYAAGLIWAGGQWAAIDRGSSCEAGARSIRIAQKGRVQAHSGFAFDRARNGQFFAQLSRIPRPGSTVVLTVGTQPFLLAARGDWAWSTNRAQEAGIIAAARMTEVPAGAVTSTPSISSVTMTSDSFLGVPKSGSFRSVAFM